MDLFIFSFLLLSSSFFVVLLSLLLKQSPSEQSNYVPYKPYPLVGNLPHFLRNGHRLVEWTAELLAASPTGTVVIPPVVFTANPANVEHMCKSHFHGYAKDAAITQALSDFLGRGIFNVNGEEWRSQRKDASHEFNARSLRAFVLGHARREIDERLLPLLARAGRTGLVFDLQDVLVRFAFDNICNVVFDADPNCLDSRGGQGERFFHAFEEAIHLSVDRAKFRSSWMWKLRSFLGVGPEKRLRKAIATVHENVDKVVKARRREHGGAERGDFLSRFAESCRSDELIRDIIVSFIMAGSDTTPSALSWFFWILSSKPQVVARIREELKQVLSKRGGGERGGAETLTLEELREMNYLHAALSESLRLYPVVPLLPRECRQDDEQPDGTRVKKGWTVMCSSYAMGRTESLWGADCGEFRPERWLDENGAFQPKSPFTYPVFHGGPRMCMGKDMAYIQMKLIAASVLERFEVEATAEASGRPFLSVSMRMEGGLPVRVKEIKDLNPQW